MKNTLEDLVASFRKGESLTTSELEQIREHYETLGFLLKIHGDLYRLVLRDTWNELDRITGMLSARKQS